MVLDFGISKGDDGAAPGVGTLTATGAMIGTPYYLAPEQILDSKSAGPASDQYAVGVILYECLTGHPPFKAASPLETLQQVLEHTPTPPHMLNPKVDSDLVTVCLKCLEKDPAHRYPAAAELADPAHPGTAFARGHKQRFSEFLRGLVGESVGKAAAKELAGQGWRVIGVGRNPQRSEAALAEIRSAVPSAQVDMVVADLAELAQAKNAAREIRALDPRIPILMISGGDAIPAADIEAAGIRKVLKKPHTLDELERAIREVLGPQA